VARAVVLTRASLRTISRSAAVSVGHLSGVFAGEALSSPDVAVAIARALKATTAEQDRVRGYPERAAVDRSATRTGAGGRVVPRQLPTAVAQFAGRADELATLTGLLRRRAKEGGTVLISAIGGTAGVGKTALAVYWAHRVAGRFPDGQLYVDLRGFSPSGQVVAPAEAVRASSMRSTCRRGGSRLTQMPKRRCIAARWRGGGCWSCWTTPMTPRRSDRCSPPPPPV